MNPPDPAALLARYDQLRALSMELNDRLIDRIPRSLLLQAAGKLGMREGKRVVFESEDEHSLLMDYCIYAVRKNGSSVIQQALRQQLVEPGSEAETLLNSMARSRLAIIQLGDTISEGALMISDTLAAREHLLMDRALAAQGRRGLNLVTRLIDLGDFSMTSGAVLPVTTGARQSVHRALLKFIPKVRNDGRLPPGPEAALAAELTRILRRAGASQRVGYV